MGDTWLRLRRWVRDVLDIPMTLLPPPSVPAELTAVAVPDEPPAATVIAAPPDRHEVAEGRAMWHASRYVEVIPGSGGRRWKPGTVQTQLIPAVPGDATEVLAERRPGWPS